MPYLQDDEQMINFTSVGATSPKTLTSSHTLMEQTPLQSRSIDACRDVVEVHCRFLVSVVKCEC